MVTSATQSVSENAIAPFVESVASELAQALMQGRLSLASYCHDVPIMALSGLLGLDQEEQFKACVQVPAIVAGMAPGASGDAIEQGAICAADLMRTTQRLLCKEARNDLVEALRSQARLQSGLSLDDACANAIGLLIQTYEATAGLIGNTMLALDRHRQWLGPFTKDSVMASRIVSEVLRWDPSIHNTRRFAHAPLVVGAHEIAIGDLIVVMLAASNRDPAHTENSDQFDPSRQAPNNTLGQGRHACVGEAWATLIVQSAVRSLLERGFELEEIERPVRFRAVKNARVPELQVRAETN